MRYHFPSRVVAKSLNQASREANCGIGLESARKFAQYNANVTLACRDREKGESAKRDITATTGNAKIEVRVLDLATFHGVHKFVEEWGDTPGGYSGQVSFFSLPSLSARADPERVPAMLAPRRSNTPSQRSASCSSVLSVLC